MGEQTSEISQSDFRQPQEVRREWDSSLDANQLDEMEEWVLQQLKNYYPNLEENDTADELYKGSMVARELAANALYRGNLEAGNAADLVAVAKENVEKNKGLQKRRILALLLLAPHQYELTVTDEGKGFKDEEVPDPLAEENLLNTHGRGSLLMRGYGFKRYIEKIPTGFSVRVVKEFEQ